MSLTRTATIAAALALLAGACGSGDDALADEPVAAAAAEPAADEPAPAADDTVAPTESSERAAPEEPADESAQPAAESAVPLTEALASQLRADPDSPVRTEEEAACLSDQIVEQLGEERLIEIGVAADTATDIEGLGFSDEEMSTVIDLMFGCIDVRDRIAEELTTQFGEESAACIADELDDETMSFMISLAFQGGANAELPPDFLEMFIALMETCGVDLG